MFPQMYVLVLVCTCLYFGVLLCTQPAKVLDSVSRKHCKTQTTKIYTLGLFGTQRDATRRQETGGDTGRRTETHKDAACKRTKP
jgi:hypothetical protein